MQFDEMIELIDGTMNGEAEYLELVGQCLDDIEGTLTNGTGSTEDGDVTGCGW